MRLIQIDLSMPPDHEIMVYGQKKNKKAIGQSYTCRSHPGNGEAESGGVGPGASRHSSE
jgi:hypothetical protein